MIDAAGDGFGGAATAAILLAGLIVVAGLAVGPASAGDNPAMFYFEPGEVEADAGETVTVDVVLQTTGGYEGEGVVRSTVGVEYDPDVLTALEVDRGPFLEGDDGANVNATSGIDNENGLATIQQERESDEGVAGTEPLATLTFEVADDAQPTNATLSMTDVAAVLATDHHQQTMTRDGTVVVEGGADDGEDSSDADGVILADDPDDGDADDSSAGAEAVPGFGTLATIGALGATVLVGLRRAGHRD